MSTKTEDDVDREQFYHSLEHLVIAKKAPNSVLLTRSKYCSLIEKMKSISNGSKKTPIDYRRMKRFEVVQTDEGERLFMPLRPGQSRSEQQMFVTTDEIYDLIRNCHLKFNHGGRNRMMVALKRKYKNITTESVLLYLSMCKPCKLKLVTRGKQTKSNVKPSSIGFDEITDPLDADIVDFPKDKNKHMSINTKPYPELYSRGQVDILDVTSATKDEYKYLMVYRYFITKCIYLKALKTTSIEETADALLEIFLMFGAPNILQSKNGMSVIKPICRRLSKLCADIKVVTGDEIFNNNDFNGKSNEDILKMLNEWLDNSQCCQWEKGLKFVQHSLNTTFHEGIFKSPYEAMFGANPKRGIASFMTKDYYDEVSTEVDLKIELDKLYSTDTPHKKINLEESLILPCNFIKIEPENMDVVEENINIL